MEHDFIKGLQHTLELLVPELVNITEIKPYKKNAKKHDEKQIKNVAESIKQFGFVQPIVIDGENTIIIGHCRYEASKLLNYDKVPCIRLTSLTNEQVKQLRNLDNKLNESEWDLELLAEDINDLEFDGFDVDWGLPETTEEVEIIEDEVPQVDEINEPICKLGDIWQLGEHRLMCGDSTDKETVEKLMNGQKADLVFTDPPYNIEIQGGDKDSIGKQLKKIMEDIAFISDFQPKEFLNVLPNVFEKNKLNAYIFCNKELVLDYLLWAKENKFNSNILVWKKTTTLPLAGNHRCDIEYLLLFRKNAIWHNSLPNVNYSRCLEYSRVNKEKENANHPTPKPVELISQEIQISSNPNGIVVDFFGGSGSTLIACEQLNRKCYMIELDPKYCDVIIKRWENLTGKKAIKIS